MKKLIMALRENLKIYLIEACPAELLAKHKKVENQGEQAQPIFPNTF